MKKLVMISMVPSVNQIRFVPHLAKHFDVNHYFYKDLSMRPAWTRVPLNDRCHILKSCFKCHGRYLSWEAIRILRKHNPDIILLGGFSIPSNYMAYLWGKLHGKKVGVFTERSRVIKTGELRKYDLPWKIIHWLYRKIDFVMTTSQDIVPQFRDTFHFGDRVVAGCYPSDIDKYYALPHRSKKAAYAVIYPNRMTEIYNPIGVVNIFAQVLKKHPKTTLKMNAAGELRPQVVARIRELGIEDMVTFLDGLKTWDDLVDVYGSCDIMMLPAKYSNGNFSIAECAISGLACIVSNKILGESAAMISKDDVLDVDEKLFADRICYYIENPEKISSHTNEYRRLCSDRKYDATAKFYYDIIMRMCV